MGTVPDWEMAFSHCLCLAAVLLAFVPAEISGSDAEVTHLLDVAESPQIVVLLDEDEGKQKNGGAAAADKVVKKIAKGYKLKGTEKLKIDAITNEIKQADQNAKLYKKEGTAMLKDAKKSQTKLQKQILKAQGIKWKKKKEKKVAEQKAENKQAKKEKKEEKKEEVKQAAKAEISKGAETGKESGAAAGKEAATAAAKGYIATLKKAGKHITEQHEREMVEAAAKAGEEAGG